MQKLQLSANKKGYIQHKLPGFACAGGRTPSKVLDLVSQHGAVALADLAQSIQVSESTIRRDLDYWHQQGVLKRTHGGGLYLGESGMLPGPGERAEKPSEEKKNMARVAGDPQ